MPDALAKMKNPCWTTRSRIRLYQSFTISFDIFMNEFVSINHMNANNFSLTKSYEKTTRHISIAFNCRNTPRKPSRKKIENGIEVEKVNVFRSTLHQSCLFSTFPFTTVPKPIWTCYYDPYSFHKLIVSCIAHCRCRNWFIELKHWS